MFTQNGNHRWINHIEAITDSYNKSIHSSTNYRPIEIDHQNEVQVRKNLYPELRKTTAKPKYKVGDTVRLVRKENIFAKGYTPNFTVEIFMVSSINKTRPITYKVEGFDGEIIKGSFYEQELTKVDKSNSIYPIDEILRKRKINGDTHFLVSWRGYPPEANSWILAKELYSVENAT